MQRHGSTTWEESQLPSRQTQFFVASLDCASSHDFEFCIFSSLQVQQSSYVALTLPSVPWYVHPCAVWEVGVRDGVSAQMNTQSHTIFWPKKVMVCWQMTTYCCSRREHQQRQCTVKT
jgi:hypothetical protein